MRIIIDTGTTTQHLETLLVRGVAFFYGWWVKEAEVIGYIVGVFHTLLAVTLAVLVIVSHTIYPAFWLQCVIFVCLALILIQHIVLKVCIMTVAEENLTQQKSIFHEVIGHYLGHVTLQDAMTYLVLIESIAVACFGLEITSRISTYLLRTTHETQFDLS